MLLVQLEADGKIGRGEAVGVYYKCPTFARDGTSAVKLVTVCPQNLGKIQVHSVSAPDGLVRIIGCIYYSYTYHDAGSTHMSAQAVLKWGNSLAFRIPSIIAKQMGIAEGVEVEFRVDGERLIIEKAEQAPSFNRRNLIKALKKARTQLIDFGPPRGREFL